MNLFFSVSVNKARCINLLPGDALNATDPDTKKAWSIVIHSWFDTTEVPLWFELTLLLTCFPPSQCYLISYMLLGTWDLRLTCCELFYLPNKPLMTRSNPVSVLPECVLPCQKKKKRYIWHFFWGVYIISTTDLLSFYPWMEVVFIAWLMINDTVSNVGIEQYNIYSKGKSSLGLYHCHCLHPACYVGIC